MSWTVQGRYFENCSCDVPCPCIASMDLGADYDDCRVVLAFHVDSGEVDGVDVSGLSLAAFAATPKYMHEGNWKLGLFVDDAASDEQAEKLGAVFSGALGGPMALLGLLVGEQLGVQRVPIEFSSEGGRHRVTLGEAGVAEVQDVVPFGKEDGEPVRMSGVFHPLGPDLTIGKATESDVHGFGIELANQGGAGSSAPFSWSG
jgi:hypothetical protein